MIIWSSINCRTVIVFPPFAIFLREATSETYGPQVSFHQFCLYDLFSFAFIFRSIKPKIQKYLSALYLFCDLFILSITTLSRLLTNLRHRYPKGIDNPFNMSGCEYLLFVCRGCLRCVAWFSYWFDNLGLITEGNTYCHCAASSLHLWGNTDVDQAGIKGHDEHAALKPDMVALGKALGSNK